MLEKNIDRQQSKTRFSGTYTSFVKTSFQKEVQNDNMKKKSLFRNISKNWTWSWITDTKNSQTSNSLKNAKKYCVRSELFLFRYKLWIFAPKWRLAHLPEKSNIWKLWKKLYFFRIFPDFPPSFSRIFSIVFDGFFFIFSSFFPDFSGFSS